MTGTPFKELLPYVPVTILIRHAERYSLKGAKNPNDALLTEKGIDDAREYGKSLLPFSPVTLYHSPLTRCRQTAESIHSGLVEAGGDAELAGTINNLGPIYLRANIGKMRAEMMRGTWEDAARRWFDGEVSEQLLADPVASARTTLSVLQEYHGRRGRSAVMVSHDWNVMLLREMYLKLRHEDIGFPGFLEGAVYFESDGKLWLEGSGERTVVDRIEE